MTTAIKKFARSAALAAVIGVSSLFAASSANALTTVNVGNLGNGPHFLGNLDLTSDLEGFLFAGTVKNTGNPLGAGSFSLLTFVGLDYSTGLANLSISLGGGGTGTGIVSGSWGGSPLAFSLVNKSWVANGSVTFLGMGTAFGQLLTVNYSNFNKAGPVGGTISAVPVPGAALLLLSGLGGLGFLSMRRKAVKAA